jgi:hypothetical protein
MLFVRCWNCLGVNVLFPVGPSFVLALARSKDETKLVRRVWTFSCACSNRRKGEQRIAQAFRPGNHAHKEIALKGRPPESLSMNVALGNHAWQSAALSGRIYRRCFPRAEAPTPQSLRRGTRFQDTGAPKRSEGGLGCCLLALRAIAECPNSRDEAKLAPTRL